MKYDKQFLTLLLLFTAIGMGIFYSFTNFILKNGVPVVCYFLFLYFFLVSAFSHFRILKANQENSSRFVTAFMATLGIKIAISFLLILLLGLLFRADLLVIALTFLVLYFAYTAFEVVAIVKVVKKTEN